MVGLFCWPVNQFGLCIENFIDRLKKDFGGVSPPTPLMCVPDRNDQQLKYLHTNKQKNIIKANTTILYSKASQQ